MSERLLPPGGVLILDKPTGCTSFDVVRTVGRTLGTRKCGHTGTLDPFATGLLCVCVGEATKVVNALQAGSKEYVATVAFGAETDTCDRDGEVTVEAEIPADLEARVMEALPAFLGTVEQFPPRYSAVKVDGRRLYDYARKGEEVEIPSRQVLIEELEVVSSSATCIDLRVVCGPGTYIRSLARDLAQAMGTAAHLKELRRTGLGMFSLADAHAVNSTRETLIEGMLSSDLALRSLDCVWVDEKTAQRIGYGQRIPLVEIQAPSGGWGEGLNVVREQGGRLLAVARAREGVLRVERGFTTTW